MDKKIVNSNIRLREEDYAVIQKATKGPIREGGFIGMRWLPEDQDCADFIAAYHSIPGNRMDRSTAARVAMHAYCLAEPRLHETVSELLKAALSWYAAKLEKEKKG